MNDGVLPLEMIVSDFGEHRFNSLPGSLQRC